MNKMQPLKALDQQIIEKQNFWSKTIQEWQKDKLPPSVFCKQQNINKEHFYYWRRRLEKMHLSTTAKDGAFIEISKPSTPVMDKKSQILEDSKSSLEIRLPNQINIIATIPSAEISKIIQQLGGL